MWTDASITANQRSKISYLLLYVYLRKIDVVCVRHAMVTCIRTYIHYSYIRSSCIQYSSTIPIHIQRVYAFRSSQIAKILRVHPKTRVSRSNQMIQYYILQVGRQYRYLYTVMQTWLKCIHENCDNTSQSTNYYFSVKLQYNNIYLHLKIHKLLINKFRKIIIYCFINL